MKFGRKMIIFDEISMLKEGGNDMSYIGYTTIKDEYNRIIKRLKRINRILIFLVIVLILINAMSIYYMHLTDPEFNVEKVVIKIKDEAYNFYQDITK